MDTNAGGASKDGASHEKILAVLHFRDSDLFTPREKIALELAEAMTVTPQRVTDDLFHRVQEHFRDEEIVELAATIALENYRARFNRCFAVEAHAFYPRLAELLAAAGLNPAPLAGSGPRCAG